MTGLSGRAGEYIRALWQARRGRLGKDAPAWEKEIEAAGEDGLFLRYILSTLPLSDLGEYPAALFVGFARHARMVREAFPWCRELPEHLFLREVLGPRVNTEELSDCRGLFCEELAHRVRGLALPQAILEVNRWCAGRVTYRPTDDRTSSALAVCRRGWGRCGEESVFVVNALRSVGIAARQVYAVWWSHCDDNHAWVEAWDGENWRYLGACEPEPELDRGWFTGAAARAMLIHARSFVGDLAAPGWMFPGVDGADFDVRGGVAYETLTGLYGPGRVCRVAVRQADGSPAVGARVVFSVLNMAGYRPVAQRVAGADGTACLRLGLGSVLVTAEWEGRGAEVLWDTREGEVDLCLPASAGIVPAPRGAYTFRSPVPPTAFPGALTMEQKAQRKQMLAEAEDSRRAKRSEAWNSKGVLVASGDRPAPTEPAGETKPFGEILKARSLKPPEATLADRLRKAVTPKDRADPVDPQVFEDCKRALAWEGSFPAEVFEKDLLSPRIGLEPLRAWRGQADFPEDVLEGFRCEPERAWQWVEENCAPMAGYAELPQSPASALRLGAAGEEGKRVLFCALCRLAGVPARLSALDGVPEFWQGDGFARLAEPLTAGLVLRAGRPAVWGRDYTVSRWRDGAWRVLGTGNLPIEGRRLALPEGAYQVLAVVRLPSGDQLCRQEEFVLRAGEVRESTLEFPQASSAQLLQNLPLPPFSLFDPAGRSHPGAEVLAGSPLTLLCWLEPGREPTEHLLRELREVAAGFANQREKCRVYLLAGAGAQEDDALRRARDELPDARLWRGEPGEVEGLARQLFVDPERLPLVLLADSQGRGLYACSGYNVGVAGLLLRLLDAAGQPGQ